ncbi:hypothetical protein GUJ93_ZPchr0001g31866 [Zizania palustris]|uniref:Peptidase M16 C-terminal domain-containing protein n=1 Tax=Zizania palustris TaxID=103762 RepID=A0A8J5V2S6_ZIZPA|nr:hypothetical protein GUJ93_ZPchr0001g31866 [Zizania palustris]
MVVSAAGAVNHDEVVDQVRYFFTGFSTDPTTADQLIEANPAIFTGSEVCVEKSEMPQTHLAIAFKGSSWTDSSSIPLMSVNNMSALARGISNGNLSESMMSFNTNYLDTGLFGIYAIAQCVRLQPDSLYDLSRLIMQEFKRLAFEVSETDVALARNQLKSSLLLYFTIMDPLRLLRIMSARC